MHTSKKIRENTDIKVILSGEGADEFGGYEYFKMAPNSKEFNKPLKDMYKEQETYIKKNQKDIEIINTRLNKIR